MCAGRRNIASVLQPTSCGSFISMPRPMPTARKFASAAMGTGHTSEADKMPAVGKNIPHDSAVGHVSGQSIFLDDLPPASGELLVDFLGSPVAHGRIRS